MEGEDLGECEQQGVRREISGWENLTLYCVDADGAGRREGQEKRFYSTNIKRGRKREMPTCAKCNAQGIQSKLNNRH